MIKLYVVRHGEGKDSKNRWQSPDTPLSEFGEKQAIAIGKSRRIVGIDTVITSNLKRAKNTAKHIVNSISANIVTTNLVGEREQDERIYGSLRTSKISQQFSEKAGLNYKDIDWKFTPAEESIREVRERAKKFKKQLVSKYKDKGIILVSHEVFIRCLVGSCLLGDDPPDDVFLNIYLGLYFSNASVTRLAYGHSRKRWQAWYINDTSHLWSLRRTE